MKYEIVASPIRGQKITKYALGVRELHDTLSELRDEGYEIKRVRRVSKIKVLNLSKALQLA